MAPGGRSELLCVGRGGRVFETLEGVPIKVASLTPLRVEWPHRLCDLARGIRIIEKPVFNEQNWDFWNLRRTERREALERSHWLCAEAECEWRERGQVLSRLRSNVQIAMLGLQLWCLKGWDGIIVDARLTDAGTTDVEGVYPPEPYWVSQWSGMMDLRKLDLAEATPLVEGTFAALESGAVRAINPFEFLEIPRRSPGMTHFCSFRATHSKNTIWRRARRGPAISSTP